MRTRGFTLMELMIVLAVVGVVLTFAVPNFRTFLLNNRMTGSANDLLASIQLARTEAIKRQQPVAVCGSANPQADPPACAPEFTEVNGWAVWVDTNDDAVIDVGEPVISTHEPLHPELDVISNGSGFVSYGPNGFSRVSVNGNAATNLVLMCDERDDTPVGPAGPEQSYRKRVVALSQTGRAAVLKRVAEIDPFGAAVDCP